MLRYLLFFLRIPLLLSCFDINCFITVMEDSTSISISISKPPTKSSTATSISSESEFFEQAKQAVANVRAAKIQSMAYASAEDIHSITSKKKVSSKAESIGDDDRDDKHLHVEKSQLAQMSLQRQVLTMSALALSVFIGSLDQTIVASSMPAIANYFDALGSVNWIATGFLLASTALQPLYGRMSDIFGRIETLMSGLLVFLVGSAISGAAQSMGMLIGGRVIQGLGASALISLVMVIVSDITIERERAKVTSVFASIWAASSVLGPVLGGVFTESAGGWRWVFYFSLPVGGVAGIFIAVFLRLPRPEGSLMEKLKRIDVVGTFILVVGLVMVLLALSFGGVDYPWKSATVVCLLAFGVVAIGVFVLVEWKVPAEPIMPLRLFQGSRNVGLVLFIQIFVGAALFGPTFYIPIYFSVVDNSSAISAGLYLLPYILPISIVSTAAGFVVSKTGRYRELMWLGGSLLTTGLGLLALLDKGTSTGKTIGLLLLGGCGLGCMLQPLLLALQTAVQPEDMATATTLFVAIRTLGGSIGLAVFQTVLSNSLAPRLTDLTARFPEYGELIQMAADTQSAIHGAKVPPRLTEALVGAYVESLRNVFFSMIPFGGMVLVLSLYTKHIPLRTRMAQKNK